MRGDYIKGDGQVGRMGARLMTIVAEGERGRVYLPPTPEHEAAAQQAKSEWKPELEFFQQALGFRVGNYGMTKWSDLFTPRQLKGTAREDSDVDLLVEFQPDARPTLLTLAAMEDELSRLLGGRRVDLRTPAEISRYFRQEVLREAEVQALPDLIARIRTGLAAQRGES